MKKILAVLLSALLLILPLSSLAASGTIGLDGVTYDFPCRVGKLLDNGWSVSSGEQGWTRNNNDVYAYYNESSTVPKNTHGSYIFLKKGSKQIAVSLAASNFDKPFRNLCVSSITCTPEMGFPTIVYQGVTINDLNEGNIYNRLGSKADEFYGCDGDYSAVFYPNGDQHYLQIVVSNSSLLYFTIGLGFALDF